MYSSVSIRGGSLHVSKTQNSTYFFLPEALLAPCSQRRTSRRAWPPRCRRASTPQGQLGWGSRHRASPRGLGRRPWRARSSPWTLKSKPFLQPPSPRSSCMRPALRCWVSPSASVCARRGHTSPPCAPPQALPGVAEAALRAVDASPRYSGNHGYQLQLVMAHPRRHGEGSPGGRRGVPEAGEASQMLLAGALTSGPEGRHYSEAARL